MHLFKKNKYILILEGCIESRNPPQNQVLGLKKQGRIQESS